MYGTIIVPSAQTKSQKKRRSDGNSPRKTVYQITPQFLHEGKKPTTLFEQQLTSCVAAAIFAQLQATQQQGHQKLTPYCSPPSRFPATTKMRDER